MIKTVTLAEILLVEDNEADAELLRFVFEEEKFCNRIHVLSNGREALDYLLDEKMPKPDLIFLDFSLPGLNGKDLLKEMSVHAEIKNIPVVFLSGSKRESILLEIGDGIHPYFVNKPLHFKDLKEVMKKMKNIHMGLLSFSEEIQLLESNEEEAEGRAHG